ncbi:uncharacterized protein SPSK_07241 [Sporothrix schenckii 1099-18]|uniref:Uncharacterized protein n=1 Tax=Sporothrix schenckii 1099-18 TaxID=1397361 RepID=A0A0F2MJE4_SPOSC|nr:uncharacterized protein SPSK_07241 [Sporothrix schenckii 1099-18]KJR88945.1 hypothetical protein SPSK_07241 [Sporothrix schenckii 1099-18]
MAPRGRPPGRKNGGSHGAVQLQSNRKSTPASTPKAASKAATTPATAPTKKTTTALATSTNATPAAATPQAATPQATPLGRKSAAKKGKLARPAKGTPRSMNTTPASAAAAAEAAASATAAPAAVPTDTPATPATPAAPAEIRVAPISEILATEHIPEPTEPATERDVVSIDSTADKQPNGTSHAAEQSVLPDESRIDDNDKETSVVADDPPTTTTPAVRRARGRPPNSSRVGKHGPLGYTSANVDLDAITYRQLSEDIKAYEVDLDFCQAQLDQPDLTPQESRTLQLRRLDLSHQVRHCRHRQETLEAQRALHGGRPLTDPVPHAPRVSTAGTGTLLTNGSGRRPVPNKRPLSVTGFDNSDVGIGAGGPSKRARAASEVSLQDTISMRSSGSPVPAVNGIGHGQESNGGDHDDNQSDVEMVAHYTGGHNRGRSHSSIGSHNDSYLGKAEVDDSAAMAEKGASDGNGFWKCRLCVSAKYQDAKKHLRQPANPSLWPLRRTGRLMTHCLAMHVEHTPEERCMELGDALDHNRGPFEYWTRQKNVDVSIPNVIAMLKSGSFPDKLAKHNEGAAKFLAERKSLGAIA